VDVRPDRDLCNRFLVSPDSFLLRDFDRENRPAVPGRFSSALPRDLDLENMVGFLDRLESFLPLNALLLSSESGICDSALAAENWRAPEMLPASLPTDRPFDFLASKFAAISPISGVLSRYEEWALVGSRHTLKLYSRG
jgi:hypothetical protein